MPWTKTDYPDSMKHLDSDVRNKAIEMANAMLEDGMEEGRAISIATSKARDFVNGSDDSSRPHYEVKAQNDAWILMKKNGERSLMKEETKEVLLEKAKSYVNDHDGILTIYQEDGDEEQTLYK